MPDISIRVQIGDAVEVVHGIRVRLEDPTALMKDWLLLMIRSTHLTAEAQGRPSPWHFLAQSTIEGRLRRNAKGRAILKGATGKSGAAAVKGQNKFFAAVGEMKILRVTGRLMMGVGDVAAGAFENGSGFGESDQFTATLGSNHPGAFALQFIIAGGRPFLLFQDVDEQDGMDITQQFVMGTGPYAV
jgi:hypothetical protein